MAKQAICQEKIEAGTAFQIKEFFELKNKMCESQKQIDKISATQVKEFTELTTLMRKCNR